MDSGLLDGQRRLVVRKRLRLWVGVYDVFGQHPKHPIAYARAQRSAPEVTVHRDEGRGPVQFTVRARDSNRPIDALEVAADEPIGVVRAKPNWGPRQWFVEPLAGPAITGRERSVVGSFLRGIGGLLSVIPAHFDFGPAFTVHRRFGVRPRYVVEVNDDTLDRRLVTALVVALDWF